MVLKNWWIGVVDVCRHDPRQIPNADYLQREHGIYRTFDLPNGALNNLRKLKFQPGFRLFAMDVGILMLGVYATVLLARLDERLGLAFRYN